MKRIILLHGVGSTGAAMKPLADALNLPVAMHFPDGPEPFEMGPGRQWFSIRGVTEANRPGRIAAMLPAFREKIEAYGDPGESVLLGFSQGAIMSLHAAAAGLRVAGVVALSGRLAGPVPPLSTWPPIWLLHGTNDAVISADLARMTETWLETANAKPILKLFDALGHTIDGRVLEEVRGICQSSTSPPRFPAGGTRREADR